MQYEDYTFYYQLNHKEETLFIKVENNIKPTVYETTLYENNNELETIRNLLDKCLTNKEFHLKINVLHKQLQIICLYNSDIIDIDIVLEEVEIKNIELINLNKKIHELENKIKIYEEHTIKTVHDSINLS